MYFAGVWPSGSWRHCGQGYGFLWCRRTKGEHHCDEQSYWVAITTPVNDSGEYQVLALIPGNYTVKASADGFESVLRDDIELHVQDRLSIEFVLKVGSMSQEVVVTGGEPLLQTQSADVGNVVDTQLVNDLPLKRKALCRFGAFGAWGPEVLCSQQPRARPLQRQREPRTAKQLSLNGVDNNSWSENLQEFSVQVVQPPPDAVQEFRVQTRTYSTEFGNSAGAVINATIKSGTNDYHGNLFEYMRNAALDANSWVNDAKPSGIAQGTLCAKPVRWHFRRSNYQGQDFLFW